MLLHREHRLGLAVSFVIATVLAGAVSLSFGQTRSYYDITLDREGALLGGAGDGYTGSWYYYPDSDEYVMWFDSGPYDGARPCVVDAWAYIEPLDPARMCSIVEVSMGWSTPAWSSLGKSSPPLPADTAGTTQNSYVQRTALYEGYNVLLGQSVEPKDEESLSYTPAWVCMIVRARNVHVYRWVTYGDPAAPDDDEDPDMQLGACCNQQTGECYIASLCVSPFVWLGAGTNCSTCTVQTYTWDFGDAPAPYPTLSSANGARHTVNPSVYLGAGVSRDSDGKPSAAATGDDYDDGVSFTSTLVPGLSATVQITASARGVINAWIDFNRDGDWADAGEKILVDEPVNAGTTAVSFTVPSSASAGSTFARFRFSTGTGLNPTGLAADGEVEDYSVQVNSGGGGDGGSSGIYVAQSPQNGYYPKWSKPAKLVNQGLQGWIETSSYTTGPILADDWSDADQRPVTGIRWWGGFAQWLGSAPPTDMPSAFHISIWTDAMGAGYPSTLVWETTCTNWAWVFSGYAQDPRGQAANTAVFEMNHLLSQDKWFYPTPAMGSRYWVGIAAVYGGQAAVQHPWGILTRQGGQTTAAMRIQAVGSAVSASQWPPSVGSMFVSGLSVVYPQTVAWDLSLELISSKPGWGGGTGSGCDVNGDGRVNTEDMAALLNCFLGGEVFD